MGVPTDSELISTVADLLSHYEQAELLARCDQYLGDNASRAFGAVHADSFVQAAAILAEAMNVQDGSYRAEDVVHACLCLARTRDRAHEREPPEDTEGQFLVLGRYLQGETPTGAPTSWGLATRDLADLYLKRSYYGARGKPEEAIRLYQQALTLVKKDTDPVEWADICSSLATAYTECATGDRLSNLEAALQYEKKALEVRTRERMPVEWAMSSGNLALTYFSRLVDGKADNIEQALVLLKDIVDSDVWSGSPQERAYVIQNLGACYVFRIYGDREENLGQAITLLEQVLPLDLEKAAPLTWSAIRVNLAIAYRNVAARGDPTLVERSIELLEQALRVRTRKDMPAEWASTCVGLASAYGDRTLGDRLENTGHAIGLYRGALEVLKSESMLQEWVPTSLNLALEYERRAVLAKSQQDFEEAIGIYTWVINSVPLEGFADYVGVAQRRLGALLSHLGRWEEARGVLASAVETVDDLYYSSTSVEARQAVLRQARDVSALAAYAIARAHAGDDDGERLKTAALLLDTSRARWLSERLALSHEKPSEAPTHLWTAFVVAREAVHKTDTRMRQISRQIGPRLYLALAQSGKTARQALRRAINELRVCVPDFMPQLDVDDLEQASHFSALVYIVPARSGGLALVVYQGVVYRVWLPLLTNRSLRTRVHRESAELPSPSHWVPYRDCQTSWSSKARSDWLGSLTSLLAWLEESVMGPIFTTLMRVRADQATLIPSQALCQLPLHAALADQHISWSYAPNSRVLSALDHRSPAESRIARALVVGNLDASLPYADAEVAAVARALGDCQAVVLRGAEADVDAVVKHLADAEVWHFASHGRLDPVDELESALLLAGDTRLSLRTVLGLNLSARLAVLSTCDVGTIGISLPDEVISLPTGLIYAGVGGVISAMWSVDDICAALLMARFYEVWRRRQVEPPVALRIAQSWLRAATNGEIARYLHSMGEEWTEAAIGFMLAQPDARPYAHPYYWAAFCYTGV
jgi:CHAT domain-containing protein/tetratricopeptide (TPR) repeat protein